MIKAISLRTLAALLAVLLTSTGCFTQAAETPKQSTNEATPGGKLVIGITTPGSIEPSNAFEPMGKLVVRALCDPLVDFDPETGELKPAIAESWLVSDNGTRLTIKLREGVMFHSGEELQADDVVFSLSRVADSEYASSVASLLEPVAGYEFIHGDEETDNEEFLNRLAGVRATESYGVEIMLKEPLSDFIRVLAHPLASPISKDAAAEDPDEFERSPVCAGPYRMAAPWQPGETTIRLERFADYYGQNLAFTSGGRGYPDELEFRIDQDEAASYNAGRAGNSDVFEIPAPALNEAGADPGFFQVPSPTLEYIGLPTSIAPFKDARVRRAFSIALDRTAIVQTVFSGGRLPATGFLPPSVGDLFQQDACGPTMGAGPDVERARGMMSEAGTDLSGQRIRLYFNEEFQNRSISEAAAAQWNAAFGVEFDLAPVPWEEFIARAAGQPGFDAPFRMSWAPEYISPDRYLFPLFHSGSIGFQNFARYSSAQFDRLMDRSARRTETEEDFRVEYQRLEDFICEQMPVVPITFGAKEYLHSPRVGTATESFGDLTTGMPALRELFVKTT